jgi:hypothetical protein
MELLLSMLSAGSHVDDRVALGIEGDHTDVRPVACVAGPACRVALLGFGVERVASRQDGLVITDVSLLRADVADATVAVINVVPTHELGRPGPGLIQVGKAVGRELGPVLGGAEQRLGIGVVVTDARPRVRRLDDQPLQHRQLAGCTLCAAALPAMR